VVFLLLFFFFFCLFCLKIFSPSLFGKFSRKVLLMLTTSFVQCLATTCLSAPDHSQRESFQGKPRAFLFSQKLSNIQAVVLKYYILGSRKVGSEKKVSRRSPSFDVVFAVEGDATPAAKNPPRRRRRRANRRSRREKPLEAPRGRRTGRTPDARRPAALAAFAPSQA
jgi:hypothetical protein